MKNKRTIKIIAIFLAGFLIGSLVVAYYTIEVLMGDVVNAVVEGEAMSATPRELIDVDYAYYFLSPETGIYALKHRIAFRESYKGRDFVSLDDRDVLEYQALDNIRIGLLYEKMGETVLAKEHFDTGVDLYSQSGKEDITQEGLMEFISTIDLYFAKNLKKKGYGKDTPEELLYEFIAGKE